MDVIYRPQKNLLTSQPACLMERDQWGWEESFGKVCSDLDRQEQIVLPVALAWVSLYHLFQPGFGIGLLTSLSQSRLAAVGSPSSRTVWGICFCGQMAWEFGARRYGGQTCQSKSLSWNNSWSLDGLRVIPHRFSAKTFFTSSFTDLSFSPLFHWGKRP